MHKIFAPLIIAALFNVCESYAQFDANFPNTKPIVFEQGTVPDLLGVDLHNIQSNKICLVKYDSNPNFTKRKRLGIALTGIGLGMIAGGAIMMANADALYYRASISNHGSYSEGDPLGGFGVVTAVFGLAGVIPGAIVWRRANSAKRYREKYGTSF